MVTSPSMVEYDNVDIAFQFKDGRKVVADTEVAYLLPSDPTEVERLRLNHDLWKLMLGGLFKTPLFESLEKGITVLDVGCGPGFWIRDMALLYPKSRFIGIDMADVFITADLPSNVQFHIVNAAKGLPFEDASFDFVFQRFLVMGFPTETYKHSVQEIKRVLKPQGRIEILELVNHYTDPSPSFSKISSWIDQALSARNMDSYIGDKISSFLQEAGFHGIKDINYNVPIGWGGQVGDLYLAIQRLALPAVGIMVSQLTSVTNEEYKRTTNEALTVTDQFHSSTRFRLICATK